MRKHIFLTGASGMVGQEIFRWLLNNTDAHIWLLQHTHGRSIGLHTHDLSRVSILKGDVQLSDLGLTKSDLEDVRKNATDFIHAAGTTNFNITLEHARRLNVEGTKNTFYLAESCKEHVHFGFISTAYVAGKRAGIIHEHELTHNAGFVNMYEQSKYETELWLESIQNRLPYAVYRLSTLLGESSTGRTSQFIAPHQLARFFYLGLIPMLPGKVGNKIDLLSTDHALKTVCELHFNNFKPAIYHITTGFKNSLTIDELIEVTYETFKQSDALWSKNGVEKPLLVNKVTYDLFLRSVEETTNPLFSQIIANTKFFADQLFFPKDFNSGNVIQVISEYYTDMPLVSETYKKMLLFCLRTNWGRNNQEKND